MDSVYYICAFLAGCLSVFFVNKFYKTQNQKKTDEDGESNLLRVIEKYKERNGILESNCKMLSLERKTATQESSNKISELEKELAIKKSSLLTKDAEYLLLIENEKIKARKEGQELALQDYKIVCTPFLYYSKSFFKSFTRGGYRFQLMVKGIPAFSPAEITIEEKQEFDDETKQTILSAVNTALKSLEGYIGGGIPIAIADTIEKNTKRKDKGLD